jgi:hypothetical protein
VRVWGGVGGGVWGEAERSVGDGVSDLVVTGPGSRIEGWGGRGGGLEGGVMNLPAMMITNSLLGLGFSQQSIENTFYREHILSMMITNSLLGLGFYYST